MSRENLLLLAQEKIAESNGNVAFGLRTKWLEVIKALNAIESRVDRVNVREFGALGDGEANDTAAINLALSGGGKIVYFPAGNYKYTAPLRVFANTSIEMDPNCVLLDHTAGSGGSYGFINGELGNSSYATGYDGDGNITIRGGQMDGAARLAASKACNPICFAHGQNIRIEGVYFRNNYKSHFIEINACRNVWIKYNIFDTLDPDDTPHSRECINIDYAYASGIPAFGSYDNTVCDSVTIEDNVFLNGDVAVGSHAAPAGSEPNHLRIRVRSNYVNTMISAGIAPQFWSESLIEDNDLIDCGTRILRGWGIVDSEIKGNRIRGGGPTACVTIDDASGREPDNVKVTGNWIWDSEKDSVSVNNSTNVQVVGNHIFGAANAAIFFNSTAVGGEVASNFIHGANQDNSAYAAIRISGDDIAVHDNHVDHGGYPVQYTYAIEAAASAGNCLIDNNAIVDGSTAGIMVDNTVARVDGSWCVTLADDTAVGIDFPSRYKQGLILIGGHSTLSTMPRGVFWARAAGSPVMVSVAMIAAANVTLTTGALTGTTGTDGNVTLSAHTDGKIYIENRAGTLRRLTLAFVGH